MFTKKQEFELITSISGRGEIPMKFAYLGQGANNWDNYSKTISKKGIHQMEQALLQKRLVDFLRSFNEKKLNIIDLGCGNGTPILPIIKAAQEQGFSVRYAPIDISNELLEIAEKTIKANFPRIEIAKKEADFEAGNFSDFTYSLTKDGYANLFIFFGNTIGNFSDPNRVLSNFRDSMGLEDYLLIGTELENLSKTNLILEGYRSNPLVEIMLTQIPKELGMDKEDYDFIISWNEREQQVDMKISLKKEVKIKIGSEKITMHKYEQILLARSKKHTENTITNLLSGAGFRNELLTTDKERSYVLTLVQPTRYSV